MKQFVKGKKMFTEESLSIPELENLIGDLQTELDEKIVVELAMAADHRRDLSLQAARGDKKAQAELEKVKLLITSLQDRKELLDEAIDSATSELDEARICQARAIDSERRANLQSVLAQRREVAESIDIMLADLAAGLSCWMELLDQCKALGDEEAKRWRSKYRLSSAIWYWMMQDKVLSNKHHSGLLLDLFGGMGRPSPNLWKPLAEQS